MEEIIKSITDAEQRAEQIKAEAAARAAEILTKAEADALKVASDCADECKLYREKEIAKAEREAEEQYCRALEKKRAEAKLYADSVLKNADPAVNDIVRRIARGNS